MAALLPVISAGGGRAACAASFCRPRPAIALMQIRGRKSRGDPKAKSKAEHVRQPTPVDVEEMMVLSDRYEQYRFVFAALRREFRKDLIVKKRELSLGLRAEERAVQEAEEQRQLLEWNNAENERLRLIREERYRSEVLLKEKSKQQVASKIFELEVKKKEEREEIVRRLKEEVKNFITLENLDARIDAAIDNPKNFNFAVDKEGRIVKRTAVHLQEEVKKRDSAV
ncbi:small ribosomal subunit protein mS26 [Petromyzon marinus]|uniref:small ribosomal subunit protein mS26 n=1 Tax=Petromyzon marinus TaxID=7757 RepID=UPI003F6F9F32